MTYDSCFCDYSPAEFSHRRHVKHARREYHCEECRCVIKPGDSYEYVFGSWDGNRATFRTCFRCVELREWAQISVPCFCWAHGNLHDDVRGMVDEVRHDVPGFFFEYGRRIVRIKRARAAA